MRMEAIAIKPAANARERLSRNLPTPPTAQPRSMAGINVGYHESCRAARSVPRIRHVVGDKAGIQVACGGRRLAVKLLGRKILKIRGSLGEARVVGGRNGACDPRHGTARPPRRNSSGRVRVGLASGARIVQGIGNALPHDLAVVGIHDLRGYLVVVGIRSGRGCVLENPGLIIPPRVGKARVAVWAQAEEHRRSAAEVIIRSDGLAGETSHRAIGWGIWKSAPVVGAIVINPEVEFDNLPVRPNDATDRVRNATWIVIVRVGEAVLRGAGKTLVAAVEHCPYLVEVSLWWISGVADAGIQVSPIAKLGEVLDPRNVSAG